MERIISIQDVNLSWKMLSLTVALPIISVNGCETTIIPTTGTFQLIRCFRDSPLQRSDR